MRFLMAFLAAMLVVLLLLWVAAVFVQPGQGPVAPGTNTVVPFTD